MPLTETGVEVTGDGEFVGAVKNERFIARS
jgi:hypothetical protein